MMLNFFEELRYKLFESIPITTGLGYMQLLNRIFRKSQLKNLSIHFLWLMLRFLKLDPNSKKFFTTLIQNIEDNNFPKAHELQDNFVLCFYNNLHLERRLKEEEKVIIDIGAAHPEKFSNSNSLLKLGFKGFLVEPNPEFVILLNKYWQNSKEIVVIPSAIAANSKSKKLISASFLSSLSNIEISDQYDNLRRKISKGKFYDVAILNPNEFLTSYSIPRVILYLSIDAEGSDSDILFSWPFEICCPVFITIEHNFNPRVRRNFDDFLENRGYRHVLKNISSIDSFYILSEFYDS